MVHRHLNHRDFTPAAIDDIIGRGKRRDWAALRTALLADPVVRDRVLAQPLSYDREDTHLGEYKNLDPRWHDWQVVRASCVRYADLVFDRITGLEE